MDPTLDTVASDATIVERVLLDYAGIPYAIDAVEATPVFDRERGRFLLIVMGWEGKHRERRVYESLVHVELHDGLIWIEHDATEAGIAADLLRAGIPKERIVLAFHRPDVRAETGFAVA
jgi:XisI protein